MVVDDCVEIPGFLIDHHGPSVVSGGELVGQDVAHRFLDRTCNLDRLVCRSRGGSLSNKPCDIVRRDRLERAHSKPIAIVRMDFLLPEMIDCARIVRDACIEWIAIPRLAGRLHTPNQAAPRSKVMMHLPLASATLSIARDDQLDWRMHLSVL